MTATKRNAPDRTRCGGRLATCSRRRASRGSGLIVALSVLALLAVMATSFITLLRLDVRITRNYIDDQTCEMLAHGTLNYLKAILREDLNRTWGRYENRDTAVGFHAWTGWTASVGKLTTRLPGFSEDTVGTVGYNRKMGTAVSNDFWFCPPYSSWQGDPSAIYADATHTIHQTSLAWHSHYSWERGRIGRYYDPVSQREFDVWLGGTNNCRDSRGYVVADSNPAPGKVPIDDDADGNANPPYVPGSTETIDENNSIFDYYHDTVPFVIYSGSTFYHAGTRLSGEGALVGNVYWRWGINVGPTQSGYANLNVHGNVDGGDADYLQNVGGIGLRVRRAYDERRSLVAGQHLGRIEWQGFDGEYEASQQRVDALGNAYQGFPQRYNNVTYAPASANLGKLFHHHTYDGPSQEGPTPSASVDREKARELIRWRWGQGTGVPVDGGSQWRVGWRRDGASYYKFPSPENPMGTDRYYGVNEVMEHDYSVDHPGTSNIARILTDDEWRAVRPHVNMLAVDTILRGKIWPTEGWLPWRSAGSPGDWRHIDILKRVNLNIIGASNPDATGYPHITGEDLALLRRWYAKRTRERDRLYFMLLGAMKFTNAPASDGERRRKACQLIASLADMIDRDHDETYYPAPDGSDTWALGVEKFPVINEVAVFLQDANTPTYTLQNMRVELLNPMENIPWIPDADEAYDIRDYVITIGSTAHAYRVGDMTRYASEDPNQPYDGSGTVGRIGADGLYAIPRTAGVMTQHRTWSRIAHLGWPSAWPTGVTREEIDVPIRISLWKPLSTSASDGAPATKVPTSPDKVQDIAVNGVTRRYICVDHTGMIDYVRAYGGTTGRSGPGDTLAHYTAYYRRWDPMNPRVYGTAGTSDQSNVIWCPGWYLKAGGTLGRPNTGYAAGMASTPRSGWGGSYSNYGYERRFERNFKVVDGDLPSIGWLGELMMKNCAQDGPLTWVNTEPQQPWWNKWRAGEQSHQALDYRAKFDLMRPFMPPGKYNPTGPEMNSVNLHVLDVFTVWDPSNDGIDNDGDGAVDDEDTGRQSGDKAGPEVRVLGRMDMNLISQAAMAMVFPDDHMLRQHGMLNSGSSYYSNICTYSRSRARMSSASYGWAYGPFETIGDFMRADHISPLPAQLIVGSRSKYSLSDWRSGVGYLREEGVYKTYAPDEDEDGITNERDERDMVFTWIANHFTTRSNIFEVDLNVEISEPPFYPDRKLPGRVYKTSDAFARKQLLSILDRSTVLRVGPDGTCDFTGPVETRMLRMTDDLLVY